jgi:hypothetical protein
MSTPKYVITAVDTANGSWNYDTALPKKDRNPSWCVAFVRFKTPGAMFIQPNEDPMAERKILVVENDCVSVSVSNQKSSLGKMCEIQMKIGEIYYQNAVAPGDWVFVWMANYQDDIDNILDQLLGKEGGVPRYLTSSDQTQNRGMNTWQSGLKFIGRVMSVPAADAISVGGQRMLAQTISCQAFVELATSVYYTFVSQPIVTAEGALSQQAAAENFYTRELETISSNKTLAQPTSQPPDGVSSGLEAALTNLSKAFLNFYRTIDGKEQIQSTSPEAIIGLLFILLMGVDTNKNFLNPQANGPVGQAIPNAQGTFSDAIAIPKSVSAILGLRASKLWQVYNLYLGLQTYASHGHRVWRDFSPDNFTPETKVKGANIYRTAIRCKGFVPFLVPPIWENNSYWTIFNQFLNPIVNEMYTALRINRDGRILPALIVREKPFSTNLFNWLYKIAPTFVASTDQGNTESAGVASIRKNLSVQDNEALKTYGKDYKSIATIAPEIAQRTMYNNLPRWIIDDSVIKSLNVSPSEERRINFVQVWGRSVGLEMNNLNVSQEILKIAQFSAPNYVADNKDIHRHGLRADITETNYDVVSNNLGTITPILCRQRADWLFNGHMKLYGTVTLQGVQEPIVEGDNCQIRGVLFHIESVTHSGSLAGSGQKSFTTTLTLSNGIVAHSLDSKDGIPQYAVGNAYLDTTNKNVGIQKLPGFTDVENTGARKDRNPAGDYKKRDGDST